MITETRSFLFICHVNPFICSVCQTSSPQNSNNLFYWQSSFPVNFGLLKFAYVTNLISPEIKQESYESHLQELSCFLLPASCKKNKYMLVSNWGKSFLSLHPTLILWSQGWQLGHVFNRCFFTKAENGVLLCLPSRLDSLFLHHCCQAVDSPTRYQKCTIRVFLWHGDTVWMQIIHVAEYYVHQEKLLTDYFGHLTPSKFCGIPTHTQSPAR